MGFIQSIIKFYLAVLLFRTAMTRQELYFNPLGKIVAKLTDPILEKALRLNKKTADNILPVFVILAVVLDSVFVLLLTGLSLPVAFIAGFADIMTFLMLFYIVSTVIGSFAGNSGMSHYAMFFRRIAAFWVKLARTFIPVKSNAIVIPAVIMIFIAFSLLNSGASIALQAVTGTAINPLAAVITAVKTDVVAVTSLLDAFVWLIIIRALMSWLSPDPRNPIVQLIVSLTDPVMIPFSRVIPPIGAIDISPMILIFVVYFVKVMLIRLVGIFL